MKRELANWLSIATSKHGSFETPMPYTNYDFTKILRSTEDDVTLYALDGYRAHAICGKGNLDGYFFNRAGRRTFRVEEAKYPKFSQVFKAGAAIIPLRLTLADLSIQYKKETECYAVTEEMLINKIQLDQACSLNGDYELFVTKKDPRWNPIHVLYRTPVPEVEGTPLGTLGIVYARAVVMPQL